MEFPSSARWKRSGDDGHLRRPVAKAAGHDDRRRGQLYIVDMTARIQVFTPDGEVSAALADARAHNGRPTGLSFDRQGTCWWPTRTTSACWSTRPRASCCRDDRRHARARSRRVRLRHRRRAKTRKGNYLRRRIRRIRPHSEVLARRQVPARSGAATACEPGQFVRPQNYGRRRARPHLGGRRLQSPHPGVRRRGASCSRSGASRERARANFTILTAWRSTAEGHLYVCEFGNHRVQKFTLDGKSLGCWGRHGRETGELYHPWAFVVIDKEESRAGYAQSSRATGAVIKAPGFVSVTEKLREYAPSV